MSSYAENMIRTLTLGAIDKFTLSGDKVRSADWGSLQKDLLNLCLQHELFTPEKLEDYVAKRIRTLGRNSYLKHVTSKVGVHRTLSPHALAYQLRHGDFTQKEIASIKFPEGETAKTFFEEVDESFPQKIAGLLRGITAPEESEQTET